VIQEHESFKWPTNKEIKIWRYTNFAKFASLCYSRSLFFSRATMLGDPFEGSTPQANLDELERVRTERHTDPLLGEWRSATDEQLTQVASLSSVTRRLEVSKFFVNCWHMNRHESAAMWRLYSLADEAICVQSTFNRLANALPDYANAGEVSYLDYEMQTIADGNVFNFIMAKRRSFEHEHELRAVIWERSSAELGGNEIRNRATPVGITVPVDLSQLTEAVYISPTSPAWFAEVVQQMLETQKLNVPVTQSSLARTPVF
jgi:hypothetical protein